MDELKHVEALAPAASLGATSQRFHYAIRGGRLGVLVALAKHMDCDLPQLEAVVRAPRKALAQIAADTDLKPDAVRRCLELVANGATPSSGRQSQLSIALASGTSEWGRRQGQLRAARLLADRDFRPLLREVCGARRGIVVPWSRAIGGARTDAAGDLINDVGERVSFSSGYGLQLAHLLDGAEAGIRLAVEESLPPGGAMTPAGWISETRLDVRRLKLLIRERTGYRVGVAARYPVESGYPVRSGN